MDKSGPAFPGMHTRLITHYNSSFPVEETAYHQGVTKRELFAALAMAAIVPIIHPMTDFDKTSLNEVIAIQAVRLADALLAELAKGEGA